ncbi:MAG: pantoate--beta-alanine ligase [Bacteroidales bacterium]|jgi:pantoate--beta-alanine ligase|nr:pantoate--beta-alanine ligase [Bacteroidales bacterium]
MKRIYTPSQLKSELGRQLERSRGMVPTMGALHAGHMSLVERSVNENELTVVSIFVNPTQFNNADDLVKYPRTIDADLEKLSAILGPDDIVFTPGAADIYHDEEIPQVNLGHLDSVMEGKHRPGHFMGVVRIVKILFDLCEPGRAYFGRKDFQQLAVIRTMVKQTGLNTEIIDCPIIREASGLAMSSRNARLSPGMRERAGIIYHSLQKHNEQKLPFDPPEWKRKVTAEINKEEGFNVEYLEIVDDEELKPVLAESDVDSERDYTACIAVYAGDIRLIDNVKFSFLFSKG